VNTNAARNALAAGALLLATLGSVSGCAPASVGAQADGNAPRALSTVSTRSVRMGATIQVALSGDISSRNARVGDAWSGTVTEFVMNGAESVIPPGSVVDGVVTGVVPASRNARAMLALGIRGIRVDGHDEPIVASSEPVVAGSTRARNLGAIAGREAAGGRVGENVEDVEYVEDGENVAASDGYQVVLSDGTVVSFTVNQTVAMR
jgi:hypothetical protein